LLSNTNTFESILLHLYSYSERLRGMSIKNLLDLAKKVHRFPNDPLRYFDDAGSISINGRMHLVKVDGYALSRSLYPWCTPQDWGYRAVSTAVSDVLAKGAIPLAYAVSIGLPPDWGSRELESVVDGVLEAVNDFGGYLVNVDTNYGGDGWIDVFVLAEYVTTPIPRASRRGDILIIPRKLGFGGANYLAYASRMKLPRHLATWGCRPRPPATIVRVLREARIGITGSIDVSDTLYESLYGLLALDDLGPYIDTDPRSVLISEYIGMCMELDIELEDCALMTCEEYVPILSVKPGFVDSLMDRLRSAGFDPIVLGVSVSKDLASWRGRPLKEIVWDHLTDSTTVRANYVKSF